MAIENIKKAIIALEKEMTNQAEIEKRVELIKMFLTGFYYKSIEEFELGKFPDSRVSLKIYAVLSERMLGKFDPFYLRALMQCAEKDAEASYAFMNHKKFTVNYAEDEMNSLKKTSYKAFEFSEDRINQLASLLPEEFRVKEPIKFEEDSNNADMDHNSSSPATKIRNKIRHSSFQSFLYESIYIGKFFRLKN